MHPDAPGGSPEAFHAINDAYSVLGDEAARAAYDRSHVPASQRRQAPHGSSHSAHFHPHSPEARRASSGPHRAWGGKPPPSAHYAAGGRQYDNFGAGMGMGGTMPGSTASARSQAKFGRRGSGIGGAAARARQHESRLDGEVSGESVLWRAGMIVGIVLLIVGITGRLSASADAGEGEEDVGHVDDDIENTEDHAEDTAC